jgi:hypothetical protein
MNKKKLIDALENLSKQPNRGPEEQFFIRILRQVWRIDWSVAPPDIWRNLMSQNQDYFLSFMELDDGDETEEKWLLDNMDEQLKAFIEKSNDAAWKVKFVAILDELNQLPLKIQK